MKKTIVYIPVEIDVPKDGSLLNAWRSIRDNGPYPQMWAGSYEWKIRCDKLRWKDVRAAEHRPESL